MNIVVLHKYKEYVQQTNAIRVTIMIRCTLSNIFMLAYKKCKLSLDTNFYSMIWASSVAGNYFSDYAKSIRFRPERKPLFVFRFYWRHASLIVLLCWSPLGKKQIMRPTDWPCYATCNEPLLRQVWQLQDGVDMSFTQVCYDRALNHIIRLHRLKVYRLLWHQCS